MNLLVASNERGQPASSDRPRPASAIFVSTPWGYTTNAIESLHSQLRKIIKTRGHFPSDDAATKLLWLALRNITADWTRAAKQWREGMNQFAVLYDERFTLPAQASR